MNEKYCPFCMTKTNGGVCPGCGLPSDSYKSSPHQLPPGTILNNRYYLGRVLGEGGFGITYIGLDLRLEKRVAIKEYFPGVFADRYTSASLQVSINSNAQEGFLKGRESFLREARTMARLKKCREIADIEDFFEENGTAYIVMEYVEGVTLKERVRSGGVMSAAELFPLIYPVMDALSYMHGAGLIHRDISPDNLMLENGRLRLIDFGCARESTLGEMTMTVMQKQGFSPVEQYQKRGQGPWTDVYALAATLYYCLTGKVPPQAIDRLMEDHIIPPRDLGVEITRAQQNAILRGMAVKAEDRFRSMDEFKNALCPPEEEIIIKEPYQPYPDTSGPDISRTSSFSQNGAGAAVSAGKNKKKVPKWIFAAAAGVCACIVLAIILAVNLTNTGNKKQLAEETTAAAEESLTTQETTQAVVEGDGWSYDPNTCTLTITGMGQMEDYESTDDIPWYEYHKEILYIEVKEGITGLGSYAFYDCSAAVSVTLPSTLVSIGESAFGNCTSLTEITIPDTVTGIGESAFEKCASLTEITIPDGVTSLPAAVFFNCSSLVTITLPDTLTSLGEKCFTNCKALLPFTLPKDLEEIGRGCFGYCHSMTEMIAHSESEYFVCVDGVLFTKDMSTLLVYPSGAEAEEYSVPDGVTEVGDLSFYGAGNLITVNIPASVKIAYTLMFNTCWSLEEICVDSDSEYMTSSDGVLFNKDKTQLMSYPPAKEGSSYTVPDSVTKISSYAFYRVTNLEEIIIPESVTEIEWGVFQESWKYGLADIYYTGSEEDWNNIDLDEDSKVENYTLHYDY